jgi:hypothetical protein
MLKESAATEKEIGFLHEKCSSGQLKYLAKDKRSNEKSYVC